jgi:hypothetical protein
MRGSKGKEGGRGGGGFILSIIFYIYKLTQPLILKHKKVIGSIPPSPSCKGGGAGRGDPGLQPDITHLPLNPPLGVWLGASCFLVERGRI